MSVSSTGECAWRGALDVPGSGPAKSVGVPVERGGHSVTPGGAGSPHQPHSLTAQHRHVGFCHGGAQESVR